MLDKRNSKDRRTQDTRRDDEERRLMDESADEECGSGDEQWSDQERRIHKDRRKAAVSPKDIA